MIHRAPDIILLLIYITFFYLVCNFCNWGEHERAPHKRYSCARIVYVYIYIYIYSGTGCDFLSDAPFSNLDYRIASTGSEFALISAVRT